MKLSSKIKKLAILTGVLPLLYGCGGGGSGALLAFLFGSAGIGGGTALLGGGGSGVGGGGTSLATLHSPEPASMLLIGGGLMAMSYVKAKMDQRNKK